jgi:hypothetical protein
VHPVSDELLIDELSVATLQVAGLGDEQLRNVLGDVTATHEIQAADQVAV